MPPLVTLAEFESDSHGAKYRSVARDPSERRALEAALALAQEPAALQRAKDLSDRWDGAALDAVVLEIEAHPDFQAACVGATASRRLRQAVGVAQKLVMARHFNYIPKTLPSGEPDEGRLRSPSQHFTKARKYGPKP